MHINGMKYKTRIPTRVGDKLYEKDEIFEGNPMDSENPVNFDYIQDSEKAPKENKKLKRGA